MSTGCVSVELQALFFQVACLLHAETWEMDAANNVMKHLVGRAGFRGSLKLISDRVRNTKAVHLDEGSTPKWCELEPRVARAQTEPLQSFSSHEESCKNEGPFAPITCTSTVCSNAHPARCKRRYSQARQPPKPPEPQTCRRGASTP